MKQSGTSEPATEPLYLMLYGHPPAELTKEWLPIVQAGILYDSGSMHVEIGGLVRQADGITRSICQAERVRIATIADDYSASK